MELGKVTNLGYFKQQHLFFCNIFAHYLDSLNTEMAGLIA